MPGRATGEIPAGSGQRWERAARSGRSARAPRTAPAAGPSPPVGPLPPARRRTCPDRGRAAAPLCHRTPGRPTVRPASWCPPRRDRAAAQFGPADVVVNHSDTPEPTVPLIEEIQQASVVRVVPRVGTDHQRMSAAVGIEQVGQLVRRALLVGDRVVPGVGRIPEMGGVEKVVVTIDLRFVEDRHTASVQQGRNCSSITRRGRLKETPHRSSTTRGHRLRGFVVR